LADDALQRSLDVEIQSATINPARRLAGQNYGSVKVLALDHAEIVRAYLEQQAVTTVKRPSFLGTSSLHLRDHRTMDHAQNRSDPTLLLR
jgi:hypothetical protein